jgi:hypothetical protein
VNERTSAQSETWLEAWPIDVAARAVRFISFLHESASATDVELEPAESGRYRFRVSATPSAVMEALLTSSEFFPASVHSSASGPLAVRLSASDSEPAGRTKSKTSQEAFASSDDSALPAAGESSNGSSLVQAFEHLDQALGEAPAGEER